MIEILILLVVGSVAYSIFQGARRGEVSPEERRKNPTLLESAAKIAEEAKDAADQALEQIHRYQTQTEWEMENFAWYNMFERRVSSILDDAEYLVSIEEKLTADPELRRYYDESLKRYEDADLAARLERGDTTDPDLPMDEPVWLTSGPPSKPQSFSDPERLKAQKDLFDARVKQHQKFIDDIQERLRRKPQLRKPFEDYMTKFGLKTLHKDYFAATGQVSPAAGISSLEVRKLFIGASSIAPNPSELRPAPALGVNIPTVPPVLDLTDIVINAEKQAQNKAEVKAGVELLRLEIRALAEERGVPHLVHFTRCDNLASILRHGLLSIAGTDAQGVMSVRNDRMRLDGQLDGISTSIAFPNFRMFYKYRQIDPMADWAILILSPSILWEKECGFYRNNAADSRMRSQPRADMITGLAFQRMFEGLDAPRETWLRRYDPSDTQAEVMVYEMIEPRFIEAVAFETRSDAEKWAHALGGIESIYAGLGKGLFATRAHVR